MLSPTLLDQVTSAIILLDAQGRFSYLNPSAEQALTITSRNLLGKRFSYFIEPKSLPLRTWLEQLEVPQARLHDLVQLELKNGQRLQLQMTLHKVEYNQQQHLMLEWQDRDTIERYLQEQEIKRHSQITSQLLQNLAHEIKTPLSGIAGAAQLLELSSEKENLSFSQIISKEVKRLTQLVDRMLLGQKQASRLLCNIHEVLEEVIAFLQLKLPKNIELIRDYDPSLPDLLLAPEQIYQVLLNLAQNALEAIAEKPQGKITFKTRFAQQHPIAHKQQINCIRIDLIDNGPGVSPELQSKLFFPLISGKNSSGLGLGIAQSLIQQHGGLIEFQSQAGHTEFSCYLPIDAGADTNSGAEVSNG